MRIEQPYCDWAELPSKDKRRGSMWLCQACGHMGRGKKAPQCPCKPIEIPKRDNEDLRRD